MARMHSGTVSPVCPCISGSEFMRPKNIQKFIRNKSFSQLKMLGVFFPTFLSVWNSNSIFYSLTPFRFVLLKTVILHNNLKSWGQGPGSFESWLFLGQGAQRKFYDEVPPASSFYFRSGPSSLKSWTHLRRSGEDLTASGIYRWALFIRVCLRLIRTFFFQNPHVLICSHQNSPKWKKLGITFSN